MKALVLTRRQWSAIKEELARQHAPSVIMIRGKMRKVLGFTPREHRQWEPGMVSYRDLIHLDFFDESKRTFFLLKYGDLIGEDNDNRLY